MAGYDNGLGDLEDLGGLLDGTDIAELGSVDDFNLDEIGDDGKLSPLDTEPLEDEDLVATDHGSHPWGPGAGYGYRPHSMARTDQNPLGAAEEEEQIRNSNEAIPDANAYIDPETIYERESSDKTYGNGIFDMEEGAAFRQGYGIFTHDYAMPAYIANEPEMDVAESEMWDVNTGTWRVVQPSASGVQLMRNDPSATYSPFNRPAQTTPVPTVPGVPPPRAALVPQSFMEAFARDLSRMVMGTAKQMHPSHRDGFIENAVGKLGVGKSRLARKQVQALVKMGYPPEQALEDVLAHLVMHATYGDLKRKHAGGNKSAALPTIDAMAHAMGPNGKAAVGRSAQKNLLRLAQDPRAFQADANALMQSGAGKAMSGLLGGQVNQTSEGLARLFRPRNLAIAGGLGLAAWLGYKYVYKEGKR